MSAIPSALKYERSNFDNDNGRPAFGSPLDQKAREIRRFDGQMHGRMNNATTMEEWSKITDDLISASTINYKEVGGLRGAVKAHFLEDCPAPELRKKFNQALMPKKSGSIVHQIQQEHANKRQVQLAKKAARSERDREFRASRKTVGGGGQQKPGKQGKGDKKK